MLTEKCKSRLCLSTVIMKLKEIKNGCRSCLESNLAGKWEMLQKRRRKIPLYQLECVRLIVNYFPYLFCACRLSRLSSYSAFGTANVTNVTKVKVNEMLPHTTDYAVKVIKSQRIFLFEKPECLTTCL